MDVFGAEAELARLREQYAMPESALRRIEDRQALAAIFLWSCVS